MKIFKLVLLLFFVIVAIALIIPIFVNQEYALDRQILINKPKSEVFNFIKYIKNQEKFSVWASMDPDMKKEFVGVDGTVGFISKWDSKIKDVGKGEQEIIKITEGERLDTELRFLEPFQATDYAYMKVDATTENQTKVTWGFFGKMKYPMNIMLLFMNMEKMLGPDLEKGLVNLKILLEK